MRLEALGPAFFPLVAAWIFSSRVGTSRRGTVIAVVADAFALISAVFLWNEDLPRSGVLDSDPLSLFLAASVLAALVFAALTQQDNPESLCRLHLGASLSIVAVSTRALAWSVPAILLFGALVPRGKERLPRFLVPAAVVLAGLALGESDLGLIFLSAGLCALWLIASRELLRCSSWGPVTRMVASFTLLAAVTSALMRIAAWFPASAPLATIHVLALGALALGALGTLAATRITTFLTALALARAGLVWLAFLGGVHGLGPLLLELAASGVALLLVAAAAEGVDSLEEVSTLTSVPKRLVLTLGAFSACSFPPFPGFVFVFPLSSAVLDGGHAASLLVACALLFFSSLGCLRLVARAWDSGTPRTLVSKVGMAPVALAAAGAWFFAAAPGLVIDLAMAAARSIF